MRTRLLTLVMVLVITLFGVINAYAQTEWEIDWIQTINITPATYEYGTGLCHEVVFNSETNAVYSCGMIETLLNYWENNFCVVKTDADDGSLIWLSEIEFGQMAWGTEANELVYDSCNNIIATGTCMVDYTNNLWDVLVVKLDEETGEILWEKVICWEAIPVLDIGTGIDVDENDDIAISAMISNPDHGDWGIYKLDGETGDILWEKHGANNVYVALSARVLVDTDNDVYGAGETVLNINDSLMCFNTVIKYDGETGDELWQSLEQGDIAEYSQNSCYDIVEGNSAIYSCGVQHYDDTGRDFVVKKIDKDDGETLWICRVNGLIDSTDKARCITIDENEDVYAGGFVSNNMQSNNVYQKTFTVVKFDGISGDQLWQYQCSGTNINEHSDSFDLVYDPAGYIIATGVKDCINPFELQNIFTIKLNASNGNIIWESMIDNVFNEPYFAGSDYGYSVDIDPTNGEVFIGGMSNNLTDNLSSYLVLKITDIPTGISNDEMTDTPVTLSLNQNYPNPFNPTTTISFSTTESTENTELVIYNLKGQKIRQYSIFNNQSSIIWDGTDENNKPVSSGIYFYKMKSGNYTSTKKMILMK